MNRPVRVVVDATTNLDPRTRERLGVEVIPIHLTNVPAGIEAGLARGDHEPFYEYLGRPHPAAGQPGTQAGSVWEARQVFENLIRRFDCDIVCLVASGRLSAVFDHATRAAKELAACYPNRIVVQSEQAFLTLSLLGQAAAEYAATGRSMDEVLAFVEDKKGRGFVTGSVTDLGRLRRSGRVPISPVVIALVRPLFRAFGLVPTFILEGARPRVVSLVRRKRLERHVLRAAGERVGFREPFVARVAYSGGAMRAEAEGLRNAVSRREDFVLVSPVELERVSPVVGVHAGPGLVAFAALGLGYESISTPVLLRALSEVQAELRCYRRVVNAINVFPVRDGDTGSNLLAPLVAVGEGVAPDLPFPEAIERVASRVARRGGGYSGGALAAYLLGFSSHVQAHEEGTELGPATLVGALAQATDRAYEYFGADAREGTILSVMRACDRAAARAFRRGGTMRDILSDAYLAATDELLDPRVQEVEILRRERLADAGGFGFTLLMWALVRTLGLGRDPRLRERYRLVLRTVHRHAELGQRLIYRRQPPARRGYCVEACVRGEVAEELRDALSSLDNRLPDPKLTFNTVDGTTHFHVHVSEGLENEVLAIAGRHGFAERPRPPTRLAKRRREIAGFWFTHFAGKARRIPGWVASFFVNWVAYALLFPVMQYRSYRRLKALRTEIDHLALSRLGLMVLAEEHRRPLLLVDTDGRVGLASAAAGARAGKDGAALEDYLPAPAARSLRQRLRKAEAGAAPFEFCAGDWQFKVRPLADSQQPAGFLIDFGRRTDTGT